MNFENLSNFGDFHHNSSTELNDNQLDSSGVKNGFLQQFVIKQLEDVGYKVTQKSANRYVVGFSHPEAPQAIATILVTSSGFLSFSFRTSKLRQLEKGTREILRNSDSDTPEMAVGVSTLLGAAMLQEATGVFF